MFGFVNNQWLCRAVTLMPCLRSREINGLISAVKMTVSPKQSAFPSLPMLSNEKAWGRVRKDRDLLPKISGRMLFLTEEAVQTPLIIMGCALRIEANCRQSGLTAINVSLHQLRYSNIWQQLKMDRVI